jgi:hypothetical protein
MKRLNRTDTEKIIAGREITPKDCLIAGILDPYAFLGRWMGGRHAINSIIIEGVGEYCSSPK